MNFSKATSEEKLLLFLYGGLVVAYTTLFIMRYKRLSKK
jgi:hypothetical protein